MPPNDFRPSMAVFLRAFGVDATVTRPAPDDDPITTVGIWVPPDTVELPGSEFQRREQIRILAFDVDAVPTLPTGTLITAPERKDDAVKTWVVDGQAPVNAIDADQRRVIVRLHRESET